MDKTGVAVASADKTTDMGPSLYISSGSPTHYSNTYHYDLLALARVRVTTTSGGNESIQERGA